MTTHQDMLFQLGGLPVMAGIPFSQNAKYYFVDPANGSDTPKFARWTTPTAWCPLVDERFAVSVNDGLPVRATDRRADQRITVHQQISARIPCCRS